MSTLLRESGMDLRSRASGEIYADLRLRVSTRGPATYLSPVSSSLVAHSYNAVLHRDHVAALRQSPYRPVATLG